MTSVKQDSKYKIEVDDESMTVTAEAKYVDGSELTEEDMKLIAEILRQIGLVHVQTTKTFIC